MQWMKTLVNTMGHVKAGYPGGWKSHAWGSEETGSTPPFIQPTDPEDRRSLIPAEGLREYWYPALPAKAVGRKRPVALKIAGIKLVLFRDAAGDVKALWDYCPHRGVYLSLGQCYWKGYLTCNYHGATFDGNGECVEFITEGPDSKMVGRANARAFPTRTLKGVVFVWMGEAEPVAIEEDVPPEFFDSKSFIQTTFRYWQCNWMIALENTGDAHNRFFVHRNSFRVLRSKLGGRPRTPIGLRVEIVDGKTVKRVERTGTKASNSSMSGVSIAIADEKHPEAYYAVDGKLPYKLYHPRVNNYWPLHRWRQLWSWFFDIFESRKTKRPRFPNPPGWEGQRLPGIVRNNHHTHMYTRWGVPVDKDVTRTVYFFASQPSNWLGRIYDRLSFTYFLNWMINYNFSDQDYDAMRSAQYQYPEYLSSTDYPVVALRKLVTEHARGIQRSVQLPEETAAEKVMAEAERLLGVAPSQIKP